MSRTNRDEGYCWTRSLEVRLDPVGVKSVTTPFLIFINALLLLGCENAAVAGRDPDYLPYWMGITGVLASNGIWHLYVAWRSRRSSPGMVTWAAMYHRSHREPPLAHKAA